jgi:hypothetical protein
LQKVPFPDGAREKGELIYILLCHWLVQAVGTSRPTVPGSDYVCLDINKLMYDLEHDDEMVVISSLLKWLPAEVLYTTMARPTLEYASTV